LGFAFGFGISRAIRAHCPSIIFTTTRVLYPDGSKHHGVGIVPDVFVEPTQSGLRAHRDEVYETAVATLRARLGKLP
jgi:C-terminal processing protease CtpA/Prc